MNASRGRPSSPEEAKALHIARLTLRFNQAWLAESLGERPDYGKATHGYMALNEEHNWYADSLMRLGAQWQRLGETDYAVQRFQEAMKHNPVLAALMEAEVHRHQHEYTKAIESAQIAVRSAGAKQFHYVQVYMGNLQFEVASSLRTKEEEDRDSHMKLALHHFTSALQHEKD